MKKKTKEKIISAVVGFVAGLINGLFGGGGGMVLVPMLTGVLKRKTEKAHATCILIILPLCILSAIFYSTFGCVKVNVLIPVAIGVTIGGFFGAILLKKISNKIVTIIFSLLMLFAGIKMIF